MNVTNVINSSVDPSIYIKWPEFYSTVPACIFSLIATSIDSIIFSQREFNDTMSRLLLAISVSDFLYMFFNLPAMVLRSWCVASPLLCGSWAQYVSSWYLFAAFYPTAGSLAIFSILTEIFLTIQRIFVILNRGFIRRITALQAVPVLAIISIGYYFVYWFIYTVRATGRVYSYRGDVYVEYGIALNTLGRTNTITIVNNALSIGRIALVLVVMPVVNFATILVFNRFLRKKSSLLFKKQVFPRSLSIHQSLATGAVVSARSSTHSSVNTEYRASRNVALMLISMAFLYLFGNFVQRLTGLNSLLKFIKSSQTQTTLSYVGPCFLFVYPGFKLFIFLTFNRAYRKTFFRIFPFVPQKIQNHLQSTTRGAN